MEGERNSINTGALGLYYISWFRGIKRASSPPHVCLHLFQFTCCRLPLPLGPDISFQPLSLVDVHPPFSSPYSPISSPHPSPPSFPRHDSTRLPPRFVAATVSRDCTWSVSKENDLCRSRSIPNCLAYNISSLARVILENKKSIFEILDGQESIWFYIFLF